MSADPSGPDISRRRFLQVSAASGGALLVGVGLPGCGGADTLDTQGRFKPDAWIRVGADNQVTFIIGRSEMGQGVTTALSMLIAEELEVPLESLRIEMAPTGWAYRNPMFMMQATGGSTSVMGHWQPLREAGATARHMLQQAAARRWGVGLTQCRAEQGTIINTATGERLPYGVLAREAAVLPVPSNVPLKPPASFRLIGKPQGRLDAAEKARGQAQFGIDVQVPNMWVATIERPPAFGATLRRYDPREALKQPGVRQVLEVTGGVAVVADSYWQALKGRKVLSVEWDLGPNAQRSSADIRAEYQALSEAGGDSVRNQGDAPAQLSRAGEVMDVVYEVPFVAHATMEPMNCTAHVWAGGCEVWVPTQNQAGTAAAAAATAGVPENAVTVHTTQLGGGFGRRFEIDFVVDAVEVSKAVGRPVKVQWTREDDIRHDFYRPAMYHRLQAALDDNGQATAWYHRVVGPSILDRAGPAMAPAALPGFVPPLIKTAASTVAGWIVGVMTDPTAIEGASDMPYVFDHVRVEYAKHADAFVPLGFWRSVANSHTAFAVEGFIDELAHKAGEDPVVYRRRLLQGHPRHRAVLDLCAEKAGWQEKLPPGRGRGIAVHFSFNSYVAQCAEVSVSERGEVRVHRVVIAVDCGTAVNPQTIRAQMEGAMVYGLSAVLKGAITIERGGVKESNFDDFQVLRMNEMPEVEVHIMDSDRPPGGVGEPGVPPIAPAVCNAVFDAVGKRIRRLPIDPELLRTT